MKNLKGQLHIRNLDLVRDKERARQANLSGKKHLIKLKFDWATTREGVENCDEHVLEGLEPHSNLQELNIKNFMGARFPRWFGALPALVKLKLYDCKSCTEVPTIGHLPLLEILELEGLDNVSCIGDSFYCEGSATVSRREAFPALKTLWLRRMMNLVEWKGVEGVVFPSLEKLSISECFQLAITPTHFPRLTQFYLRQSHVSVIENILTRSACISLERVSISDCEGLSNIWNKTLEGCTSLRELWVVDRRNLVSFQLDFQQTPRLSFIWFYECPNLFTNNEMPRGFCHLASLKKVSIGPFSVDSIELFDWSGLLSCSSTLRSLELCGSPEMRSLPQKQLQQFTSLAQLILWHFKSVESLPDWVGNLASLRTLHLFHWAKLRYLPSVDAMARLTKLQSLEFVDCPLLKENYRENDSHSQWSKISHLPNVKVHF